MIIAGISLADFPERRGREGIGSKDSRPERFPAGHSGHAGFPTADFR
jgi:hypothetical protein